MPSTRTPVIQRRPIESLKRHPDNARLGDIEAIKESIRVNGWHGAVVVQESTGYILAGNHRTDAALELHNGEFEPFEGQSTKDYELEKARWATELKSLPVYGVDVDDVTARRILLADNKTADLATYDDTKLLRLTAQVADPETAAQILADENSTPDEITEALRTLAAAKARSGKMAGTGYQPQEVEQLALAMEPAEGAAWGSQGEGAVKIYDRWGETSLRQLVLPMMVEEYDKVLEILTEVQEKQGLITNTDAFFWLIAKAVPKRFTAPEPMKDEAEGAAPEREATVAASAE